jgi:protoheme IX farnesyltransferase
VSGRLAVAKPAETVASWGDYLALTKPRVTAMMLYTTAIGYWLGWPAAAGSPDLARLLRTLIGTALVGGGTLALNMYLERDLDARMSRTRRRPIPEGRVTPIEALAFGGALAAAGLLYLMLAVNAISALVTALTVVTYLFVYTPMKRRSALCTVAGAFPGALPPLTGWTAAGGALDASAAVLFGILFFWQLPHALAIAQLYRDDYQRAGIKLLPTEDPHGGSTGRQALAQAFALLSVGLLPTLIGLAGWLYFLAALAMGGYVLIHAARLARDGTPLQARRLLVATYLYVPVIFTAMALGKGAPGTGA